VPNVVAIPEGTAILRAMKDVTVDPNILGGIPVFTGTRVPVQALFDHLEAGDAIEDFLRSFPDVSREQAVQLVQASRVSILREAECVS